MSLRQMEFAVKVAECKSFTKAANKLKVAQPSLSQSILNLENELKVTLFDRTNTPVSLTHAGEIYISKAKVILELLSELNGQIQNISGLSDEKIKIGFSQTGYSLLPDLLPNFCKRYPNADIKIVQIFSTLNIRKMLLDEEIDIGMLILPIDTQGLSYKVIKEEKALLALPITHPLATKFKKAATEYPHISLSELKNEKFILPKGTQRSRSSFDEIFKNVGFEPNIFCETETFDIANSIVASGVGACFTLPQFIKEDKKEKIVLFDIDEPLLKRTLVLAYKKDKKLSRIEKEFLDIALQKG